MLNTVIGLLSSLKPRTPKLDYLSRTTTVYYNNPFYLTS